MRTVPFTTMLRKYWKYSVHLYHS